MKESPVNGIFRTQRAGAGGSLRRRRSQKMKMNFRFLLACGYNNCIVGLLLQDYFRWHYTVGVRDLARIWGNFLWFGFRFFSFSQLVRTLFAPFHRIRESYPHRFDATAIAENLVFNAAMRLVGFVLRSLVLALGLLSEIFMIVAGSAVFLVWLLLPLVIVGLLVTGIVLVMKP